MTTETKFEDGKLIVTRTYSAPKEAVFEAWVETNKVEKWWGCAQCTSVRSEIEPRVGGKIQSSHDHRGRRRGSKFSDID